MATVNPFDLLDDDDTGDLTLLMVAQKVKESAGLTSVGDKKGPSQAPPAKNAGPAKLPSKPLPPSQAVREARSEAPFGGRGGGRGGDWRGRGGRGRGGRGFDRDFGDSENSNTANNGYSGGFKASVEDGDSGKRTEGQGYGGYGDTRGGYRGGRRGGFSNDDANIDGERPPRRVFERRSGTGHGSEFKREGSGRGNWGTPSDEIVAEIEEPVNEGEKIVDAEKQSGQEVADDAKKESPVTESDEKKEEEPEAKEMTLEEYEKVLEEKRKALLILKSEERKVDLDKEFESMQLLSNKKNDDEIILKLGSDKDKRKETSDKAKKSVSINEFLKPAEGDNYYRSGGRGGRGGGGRGLGGRGGGYGGNLNNVGAPAIGDVGQFPSLGSK